MQFRYLSPPPAVVCLCCCCWCTSIIRVSSNCSALLPPTWVHPQPPTPNTAPNTIHAPLAPRPSLRPHVWSALSGAFTRPKPRSLPPCAQPLSFPDVSYCPCSILPARIPTSNLPYPSLDPTKMHWPPPRPFRAPTPPPFLPPSLLLRHPPPGPPRAHAPKLKLPPSKQAFLPTPPLLHHPHRKSPSSIKTPACEKHTPE